MAEAAVRPESPANTEVSEEFDLETRFVVLSFLGLVPSNILDQSFSSRGTSSGESHSSRHSRGDSGALSSLPKETLSGKVSRLGSTDDDEDDGNDYFSSHMDNGFLDGRVEDSVDIGTPRSEISQTLNDLLISQREHDELDSMRPLRPKLSDTGERHKLQKHTSFDIKPENSLNKRHSDDSARRRLNKGHSMYMSPQRPNHIPVRSYLSIDGSGDMGKHGMERVSPGRQLFRRDSDFSEGSEITVSVVSSRSSYVDVQSIDLEPLVKSNMINPNMVPLKEELKQEKKELEESLQKAWPAHRDSPLLHRRQPGTPAGDVSPEAEVAQYLCLLGDQVQERYSAMLSTAFESVVNRPVEQLTYGDLQAATQDMAGQTSGWTKIALMMVFSKQLTYKIVASGGTGVRKVTDFTTRLIEDTAASFILAKGGWHAITELELSTPCTPSDVMVKFPYEIPESSTVTGTPADYTSSTLGEPSDHEDHDELPVDPDQTDCGQMSISNSEVFSKTVEEEAEENVSRIRPDILYWRQQSGEYSRYMEEEKQRYEDEQRLWRRFGYASLAALGAMAITFFLWRRNGNYA